MNATAIEGMTQGQAGLACDRFSELCRKNSQILPKDIVQDVLKQEGDQLAAEMFEVLRKRVERRATAIVRRVKVDRSRNPQQVIDATGRNQYTDKKVVATMPKGEGEEVEVHFFKLGRDVSPAELEREYKDRGLTPDPYAQAQVNIDDPAFADEHPNGTQWNFDPNKGQSSYVTFSGWGDGRHVGVDRHDYDWFDLWWFGGRK